MMPGQSAQFVCCHPLLWLLRMGAYVYDTSVGMDINLTVLHEPMMRIQHVLVMTRHHMGHGDALSASGTRRISRETVRRPLRRPS